jgi:GNAT superfamily N-acetyltransferase
MKNLIKLIKEEYNNLIKEQESAKDEYIFGLKIPKIEKKEYIGYRGEDGRYGIFYGNYEFKRAISKFGWDSFKDIDDNYGSSAELEKYDILKYYYDRIKRKKYTIKLVDWSATNIRSGFGRKVMKKIFDLAKELKIDEFEIVMPSRMAEEILDHYENKGLIKKISGYNTTYKILKDFDINESKLNLIKEESSNYKYFPIDSEYDNEDLDDLDLDIYELTDQADNIAKSSNINILRNKDLKGIILDLNTNEVAGALWIENDSDEFSFDIAVDPKHRNKRLSYILIDEALSEYDARNSEYNDYKNKNLPMKIDVVNPLLANILKSKYGFKVFKRITNDRVLMRK